MPTDGHIAPATPSALAAWATDADGHVKTATGPAGASSAVSRATGWSLPPGVVVLVPVLRGRAAVTLGHDTSLLGPDGAAQLLVARPREHQPSTSGRGHSEARRPLLRRVSGMAVLPSRMNLLDGEQRMGPL